MDILLIEDDWIVRQLLTEVLEDEGYCVLQADNGYVALTLLQARQSLPHLILLDLRLPVMDGWHFLEAIDQNSALACIPVIIISAENNLAQTVGMRPITHQAIRLIEKPIDLDYLISTVATYRITNG